MTKKDYIRIARAIREVVDRTDEYNGDVETEYYVIERIIDSLSRELSEDNPLFDDKKFRIASLGK